MGFGISRLEAKGSFLCNRPPLILCQCAPTWRSKSRVNVEGLLNSFSIEPSGTRPVHQHFVVQPQHDEHASDEIHQGRVPEHFPAQVVVSNESAVLLQVLLEWPCR